MMDLYEQYGRLLDDLRRRYGELRKTVSDADSRLRLIREEIYELEDDLFLMRGHVNERRFNNETAGNV